MESIIYKYIDKIQLQEIITTFQKCTRLSTQVIDERGNILMNAGNETIFCQTFSEYLPHNDSCEFVHVSASKRAITLGETYIFSCHAGLNHIVFPLIHKDLFMGSVVTGPFLMEKPDAELILDISKKYKIPMATLLKLSEYANEIEIIAPDMVTEISRLLNHLMSNLITDSRQQAIIYRGTLLQQSKINEAIQMFKQNGLADDKKYPYEKEQLLISKVKMGNTEDAKAILNDLLGHIFLLDGTRLEKIKIRLIELCAVLSRAAIDSGANCDHILNVNSRLITEIEKTSDFQALCYCFQENVEIFTENIHFHSDNNSKVIKTALNYIGQHYTEQLTLSDVAGEISLSPSYFSILFKKVTGKTFKEYLTEIRIEESKRLLTNTDYSILDIVIACGFEDQSYFTKVFKKYTGMTPKRYR